MARAPKKSPRPQARPDDLAEGAAVARGDRAARRDAGMKAGGKVKKMQLGGALKSKPTSGVARGMGAATKGGNFSRA
jgi:hypothetical protein